MCVYVCACICVYICVCIYMCAYMCMCMYICVCVHIYYIYSFCVVQLLTRAPFFATPWTGEWQAPLSVTIVWSLLKVMSITSVMPSNHLILCCPLLLLPSVFPSNRMFSNRSDLPIRWPSIGASATNIQGWFPLGLTGLLSSLSKGLSSVFCSTTDLQASILQHLAFLVCVWVCVCACSWLTYITFRKWLPLFLRNKCNNQLIFWKKMCD